MTENRRIALNVVATYGRSLYALALGLFTSRWALMALGEVDFGLYGVVGSLVAFIAYFNGVVGSSIGRFYALCVGEQRTDPAGGLAKCRMWFTTAVVLNTVIPLALMVVGYPAGKWVILHFLTVPADRLVTCVWVWRFVCLSCFLGMASLPFNAMYMAKQRIASLTVYSFATTTCNAVFLYYMVTHPGVWLGRYAAWQCLLGVLPNLMIMLQACWQFPECRVVRRHLWRWANVRALGNFAFWNAWGTLGAMLRDQGGAVVVNRCFGPTVNAGLAIGTSLSLHANAFSGSLIGAFSPAICNAWGEGAFDRARRLAYRTCKFCTLGMLVFAIPVALEISELLALWLGTPPRFAAEFCLFILTMNVIDKLSVGHMLVVNAQGRIALYQAFLGTSLVLALPLAVALIAMGCGPLSVGWAMVATMAVCSLGRVWFARRLVGMSAGYWVRRVSFPIGLASVAAAAVGLVPRLYVAPSFGRICVTTAASVLTLVVLSGLFVLDPEERGWIVSWIRKRLGLSRHDRCTGCGACVAACERKAMSMEEDSEGFRRPQIDRSKCVKCGVCERVCPLKVTSPTRTPLDVLAVRANDVAVRLASSSGGVFPLLARAVLTRGGVVVGAVWSPDGRSVRHVVVEDVPGLRALQGSKYLQSDVVEAYGKVRDCLTAGREVLFSGTPCQVAAVRALVGQPEHLSLVEVVCHGVPSARAWRAYLDSRAKGRSVERICLRDKAHGGWRHYEVSLRFSREKGPGSGGEPCYRSRFEDDPFMLSFVRNLCLRPSCHACEQRGFRSGADLTLGDFWGIEKVCPALDDDRGVSLVAALSARGVRMLREISQETESVPCSLAQAVAENPSLVEDGLVHPKRRKFLRRVSPETIDEIGRWR